MFGVYDYCNDAVTLRDYLLRVKKVENYVPKNNGVSIDTFSKSCLLLMQHTIYKSSLPVKVPVWFMTRTDTHTDLYF